MIAPQGCLTGLYPIAVVEEGKGKGERGFPSSFLRPSITLDLAAREKKT